VEQREEEATRISRLNGKKDNLFAHFKAAFILA
jgi:hypothetical protein